MRISLLLAAVLLVSYPTPQQEEALNLKLVEALRKAQPALNIVPAKRTRANHGDHTPNPLWMCADATRKLKVLNGAHYCELVK